MDADIIQIVLPVALKEVFAEIAPAFTAETGSTFNVALMLNPEVPDHIARGADWSIALSNPPYIRKIVEHGDCEGGLQPLGYAPLTLAMRGDDAARPLETPEEIAAFLTDAESIALTDGGTSGAHFARLASSLGITQELHGKLRFLPGGGPMAALQKGEVEVAALPLTNVISIPGVFAKSICPPDMDVHIDLAFCLHREANATTQEFARWLSGERMRGRLSELGVLPQEAQIRELCNT